MRYAQIKSSQRLHLVCEPGEDYRGVTVKINTVSAPLCGTAHFKGSYRMTINVPLANACKSCMRVYRSTGGI